MKRMDRGKRKKVVVDLIDRLLEVGVEVDEVSDEEKAEKVVDGMRSLGIDAENLGSIAVKLKVRDWGSLYRYGEIFGRIVRELEEEYGDIKISTKILGMKGKIDKAKGEEEIECGIGFEIEGEPELKQEVKVKTTRRRRR